MLLSLLQETVVCIFQYLFHIQEYSAEIKFRAIPACFNHQTVKKTSRKQSMNSNLIQRETVTF